MARRSHDDALGVAGAETIIGAGVTVKGALVSQSDIMIDGLFEGSVNTEGDVTIGVNAVVKSSITGANVTVAGNLVGNIQATGDAFIRETGQVKGDITSTGLSINPGGVFIGTNHVQIVSPSATTGDAPPEDLPPTKRPKVKL